MDSDFFDTVTLGDGVDDFLAFSRFTKHCVVSIEVGSGEVSDEKLGAIGVWACICHRKDTWLVVLANRWFAFAFKLVAWTTHAGARWVTTLYHEVWDDTVKDDAIIEAALSKVEEAGNGDWGVCWE